MPRSLALVFIGLFFGGGLGVFLAAAGNVALDGHRHPPTPRDTMGHEWGPERGQESGHAHSARTIARTIALPPGPDAPTLELRVAADAGGGWTLQLVTTNFRFAPERANAPHRAGEGHAHLHIDGRKIARLYGPWYHLARLPPGQGRSAATVAVTLNANDHSALTVAGRPLRAERTIRVE